MPDGVFNVVHGSHDVVNGLLEHPKVKAISFVGSQPVAEYVYTKAAAAGKEYKRLQVREPYDRLGRCRFGYGSEGYNAAAFGSAGERCMACAVVIGVGTIKDRLLEKLTEAADAIQIGNGMEEDVFLGPLSSARSTSNAHWRISKAALKKR
nr:aldehyde dehydrogenase family protein [Cohnella faecalis]